MHKTHLMILTGTLLGTLAFAQQPGRAPSPALVNGVSARQALKLGEVRAGCKAP